MSEVITVTNISKRYRIGVQSKRAETFAGAIKQMLMTPVENFRRIRNLGKLNKDDESIFWALRDVSFSVQQGEVLGIIGRNGAGKSTLLKLLSSIAEPSGGEIKIIGRVASLLEVGTGFHPELTGRENVFMNGTILGMTRREITQKFEEIVEFSGVQKHIDTPVKFYSSGMKVRLGFAVAAHLEPEILIIDEVLAVGDAEFQRRCLGKMKDVSSSGRTVLFVSHNMAAVRSLCTKGIVLENGNLVFYGDSKEAIQFYQNVGEGKLEMNKAWEEKTLEPDSVCVLAIELKPDSGEVIDVDNGFTIKIDLKNTIVNKNLGLTMEVVNRDDLIVFTTGSFLSTTNDSRSGYYSVSFQIPGNLLNADIYSLNLVVGEDQRYRRLREERIFSFEVLNTATGRGSNMMIPPGIVRPRIQNFVEYKEIHEMHN